MRVEAEILQHQMNHLVSRVAGKLREKGERRREIFRRKRADLPDETLYIDNEGKWLFQDFDTEKYPETYILPPSDRIYYVYAWRTDTIVQWLWEKFLQRVDEANRNFERRAKRTGKNYYDAREEVESAIADYWAALWDSRIEKNKAVYLKELIALLEKHLQSSV